MENIIIAKMNKDGGWDVRTKIEDSQTLATFFIVGFRKVVNELDDENKLHAVNAMKNICNIIEHEIPKKETERKETEE